MTQMADAGHADMAVGVARCGDRSIAISLTQ